MTKKRPDDEIIHSSARAKEFLKKRAWKQRKTVKQVVDDLCFPVRIPMRSFPGV